MNAAPSANSRPGDRVKVFLSHSVRDADFVLRLAVRLRDYSFEPWLCETSIESGANWVESIEKALQSTDLALLIWSPDAAASFATHMEIYAILAREIAERRMRLAVVLLRDCPLPELLRPRQYIDAREDRAGAIETIVDWLSGRRTLGRFAGGRAPIFLPDYRPHEFVGRSRDLDILHRAFGGEPNIFLLYGEPGTGKSTLALKYAWETQKDFDVVVYQLCGERSLDTITSELAERLQLGLMDLPPSQQRDAVKTWLRQRNSLLVLDDVRSVTLRQLEPGPASSVLYTSRLQSLAGVPSDQSHKVESFDEHECEMLFHLALDPIFGAEEVSQHREALILFAQRVEMLPIAVAVAASLLRERAANRLDRGVSHLHPGRLTDGVTDVSALFHEAIISLPRREQRLLAACSACTQEGLSLRFACEIAQLSENDANDAADRLVHSSLLRVLSRKQRRFQLHSLLREATQASMGADALAKLKQAHAAAIERRFQHWEQRWQDCRECLEEVIPAADFLAASNELGRQWRVSNSGFRLARRIGELDIALRILQQDESFLTESEDEETLYRLQASYGNKAAILHAWDRDGEAMNLLKKQESICIDLLAREAVQKDRYHETIIKHSVAISYGSQAMILTRLGRLEDALTLHRKSAALSQELNDLQGVAESYGHQSEILKVWGRTEEAMALLKLEEKVCEMLSDKLGLIGCFGRQGTILFFSGQSEEALSLHRKAELLAIELGHKTGLSASLGNQGIVLRRMGRLDEALVLHKREEALCLELLDRSGLQVCYGNQALILDDQGFREEALNLHKKEEAICRDLGIKDSLQRSLGNQAVILEDFGRSDEAMAFRKEQEKICVELGNLDDLRVCLTGQARILMNQDQWNEAMILIDRSIQICDEIGKAQGIAKNLELKAMILQHWDRPEEALVLLKTQEEICRSYKDNDALAHNYGNQAVSLMAMGALDEALMLLEQQKLLSESLSLKKPLAFCHWNLGRLAGGVGDRNVARENLNSAHKLFSELGMANERDSVQAELHKITSG